MPNLRSKRTVAIAAAAAAALGGGGAAIAATQGGSPRDDFLNSVAQHLGVSRQKLDDATKAAAIDQVDAQLAAGKITKAQADALKARIQAGDVPFLGGPGGPGGPGMRFGLGFGLPAKLGAQVQAAASYLGLSESDLRSKLNAGQSLADIAKAQGKSTDGLKQALVAAAKASLDKAVADKRITDAQRTEALNEINQHLDDLINGELRFRGPAVRLGPGPFGRELGAAASYLGLSRSDLRTKLGSGQSLADVAKAQGKSTDGLQQAILAAAKSDLDKAVADKKLTQAQADDIYNALKARVADVVNGGLPRFGLRHGALRAPALPRIWHQ
jgi:hypothetical protein